MISTFVYALDPVETHSMIEVLGLLRNLYFVKELGTTKFQISYVTFENSEEAPVLTGADYATVHAEDIISQPLFIRNAIRAYLDCNVDIPWKDLQADARKRSFAIQKLNSEDFGPETKDLIERIKNMSMANSGRNL